jgi:uncharacterized membrane protein
MNAIVKPSISPRQATLVFLVLALASGVGVALVTARYAVSHQVAYFNLVWNLFLAWLPLGFAFIAGRARASQRRWLVYAFLWLLFLPNSPYLVTDLVHLKPRPPVPLWYDILLVQSFVLTGLLLGFLSVYLMHRLVSHSFGWRTGWIFTCVILGLTGFGIYLGRFERWNSWDLFTSPIALSADFWDMIRHPRVNRTAYVFSALCGTFLFLTYAAFYALTTLHHAVPPRALSNAVRTDAAVKRESSEDHEG